MVAVQAPEAEVVPLLGEAVDIAAVNGPAAVVLSGGETAVLAIADQLAGRGYRTKRLRVSHAFHSPLMPGMLEEFRTVVEGLAFHPAQIPAGGREPATALAGRLANRSEQEREVVLLDLVCAQAAVVLGHPGPEAVDAEWDFMEIGFDSLTSVELSGRFCRFFGGSGGWSGGGVVEVEAAGAVEGFFGCAGGESGG